MLLASVLSNCAHGPFGSGRNQQTIQESAASLSESMSSDQFEDLLDCMVMDRRLSDVDIDDPDLPHDPHDLSNMSCVRNLPVYATW